MKLKVPRADAVAFGALISSLIVVVGELHWEHPIKVAVQATLGFLAAVVISPLSLEDVGQAAGAIAPSPSSSTTAPGVPGASARPDAPPAAEGGEPI